MNKFTLMTFILLVYVGIMCFLTLMFSCNTGEKQAMVRTESNNVTSDSVINMSDKVEEQLKRSDTSLGIIENTMNEVKTLKKQNESLKVELKSTKDSLVATKKLLKKRTFIQRVLGINKDTVQISMKDTTN